MKLLGALLLLLSAFLRHNQVQALELKEDIAAPLQKAQEALSRGDYETAFGEYTYFAEEKNNPLAQFTLALFYQQGWGRPVDPITACQWHEKAAVGKIPAAQHFLGDCLLKGVHRPPDPAKAAYWYEQAAQGGHVISLCSLAGLYVTGTGVPKDPQKGLALCRGVAEQGSVPAMLRLGRLLLEGDATVRDFNTAYAWFERAAQRGAAAAQYYLGIMNRDGLGRPKEPELARYWFESAAAQGYVPAYFPTALLYFNAPPDPDTYQPRAEELAKAYLWLSATARRSKDANELAQTTDLLNKTRQLMPETWAPTLDEKVARHLVEHPAQQLSDQP